MATEDSAGNKTIDSLMRGRRTIFTWTLVTVAVALAYTLINPPRWQATAVLLLPLPDTDQSSSTSPLAALAGQSDPLEMLKGVLVSRASLDLIAEKTGVKRETLERRLKVSTDDKSNQILIGVQNADPKKAIVVANATISTLSALSGKTALSMAAKQATYLKSAVEQKEAELRQSEDALVQYQKSTLTAPDPTTPFSGASYVKRFQDNQFELERTQQQMTVAKAEAERLAKPTELPSAIPVADAWRDKISQAEYDLRVAQQEYGPTAPTVVRLQQKLDVTKNSYQREVAKYILSVRQDMDPKLADLQARIMVLQWEATYLSKMNAAAPGEAVEFQRLLREITIRNDILSTVRSRYEKARIDAEVDRVRWSLLVKPYIEDDPVNKNFQGNALVGALLGILCGSGLVLLRAKRSA